MEISQDPIQGVYQLADQLWSRMLESFENKKRLRLKV